MTTVNIHEAKTHLSRLLGRVASGEEIVIAKAGRPVAKLSPVLAAVESRKPGSAKGRFAVKDEFFEPLPEDLIGEFEK